MFISYLNAELERRKQRNPGYSIRAFANSLKMESSTLSQILARSRKLTASQAFRILKLLDIDSSLKSTLLLAVIEGRSRPIPDENFYTFAVPDADGMELWEFFGVLCVLELESTVHDVSWIAGRLATSVERVSRCIKGLEDQNYIRKVQGKWLVSPIHLTTPRGGKSEAVRNAVSEYILLGNSKLLAPSGQENDFSGATIALDSRKIPEAIRRIKEFRRSLADYLSAEAPRTSVYRLNIQFFRIDHDV
jgi:transcriptional regulator with XRE-family HTH domain